MSTLYLTVGLPRSGKSTWARQQGVPIVNPDSIRLALHGQAFHKSAEPMVWAIADMMVKALFLAGHNHIILDATNTTKWRRDQWKSNNWKCRYVLFTTEKDVCIRRAGQNRELIDVIEKMAREYEPIDSMLDEWMVPKPIEHDGAFQLGTGCSICNNPKCGNPGGKH